MRRNTLRYSALQSSTITTELTEHHCLHPICCRTTPSLLDKWYAHHTPLWHGGHIKFWSRKTLTELLRDNGFIVTAFGGVGRLPYLWKSMVLVAEKE